jgi:general nucleoside transport system permease protein
VPWAPSRGRSTSRGCHLPIGDIHTLTEGMITDAGYLVLAAVIFGNWRAGCTLLACLLFGAAKALQVQLPAMGIDIPTAMQIMLPYLLALIALSGQMGRQTAPAFPTRVYVR